MSRVFLRAKSAASLSSNRRKASMLSSEDFLLCSYHFDFDYCWFFCDYSSEFRFSGEIPADEAWF